MTQTTNKDKTMKAEEEIEPTSGSARSERQEPCDCVPIDATLCDLHAAAPALYEAAKQAANELSVMLALNPERDGGLYREALDVLNAALALVDTPTTNEAKS